EMANERGLCKGSWVWLVGSGQAENFGGDEVFDHVVVDRGHLEHAGFAEFAFDVVFVDEAVASVSIEASISGGPTGFGSEVLGHIGLGAAWFACVKEPGGFVAHHICGADLRVCIGDGVGDALVGADLAAEYLANVGIFHAPLSEPV